MKRRVVITGLGAVTAYGVGVDKLWDGLIAGKSGISKIENMDITGFASQIGGEIKNKDFNPEDYLDKKEAKRMDRYIQFVLVAAMEAYKDAGLTEENTDPNRLGVIVGSAAGGMGTIEANHNQILAK